MKASRLLLKATSLSLILCMLLSALISCRGNDDGGEDKDVFSLSDFRIVRVDGTNDVIATYTAKLSAVIEEKIGISLPVSVDIDTDKVDGAKEILIGETDRKASSDALAYLTSQTDKDAYAVQINEDSIVIVGTTETATVRAIKVFIENYVNVSENGTLNVSSGKLIAAPYRSDSTVMASNGVEFDTELISSVYQVPQKGTDPGLTSTPLIVSNVSYPSIIELTHQSESENNGKLVAVHYLSADSLTGTGEKTDACVMMSENGGKSWKCIARPLESIDKSLNEGQMAHIYELPERVGDMPEGTLLYTANSVDFKRKSNISIWRSFDCGVTWEQYVLIATGGGDREGVWEPFTLYCEEDGYLYCFFSDDSDPKNDQKIVYRRSQNGVDWEAQVDVIAPSDPTARAGMPVITKMGNGKYFMVFELVHKFKGSWGAPIFYKTASDLSSWGDPTDCGTYIKYNGEKFIESAPACAWLPAGGECGTLVVTSRYGGENDLYVSFDYGKSWETIKNPLSYVPENDYDASRMGYSAGFWVGKDGRTLYYVNCINATYDAQKRRIAFARIKIY